MAWRTAGKVGCGGGPLILFFPPCCCEPAMLEEGVSDHRHKRMSVKALPGSSLEVVKTKFFFHLLVSLLANPTRLDGGCEGAQVGLRWQVGEIVFLLSRHPVFADEPSLVAGQMLSSIGSWRARANGGLAEARCRQVGARSRRRPAFQ